jgi:RND family efflux transporter MFP subunit
LIILLPALGLSALACAGREKTPSPAALPTVAVHAVKARSLTQGAQAPATLSAVDHATISSRIQARVRRVYVHEGDRVKEGAALISLADEDIRAQLAAAQASAVSAEANARRLTTLSAQGAATKSELEAGVAQKAHAEAALRAAEEALKYAELRAPFTGRVQSKRANEGDLVSPGAPLIGLEGQALEVVSTLTSDEVAKVAVGQGLAFEAGGVRGRAEVTAIAPSADPIAHRVEVRARVVEPVTGLRAGGFARLELPVAASMPSRVWVPASALVQRGDLRGVFVVNGTIADLRWLLLGDSIEGAYPVRAGLQGDEVIIDSPGNLRDGQTIEVARAN